APLVTLTDIPVHFDSNSGVNTAVAIVNPNSGGAELKINPPDQKGGMAGGKKITDAGKQQISRVIVGIFVNLVRSSSPFEGLLFISSNMPVVVMGLAFNGPSFTSLPVAAQLNPNAVITAPLSLVGTTGILLPQIATGGGWQTRITIANTSTSAQII